MQLFKKYTLIWIVFVGLLLRIAAALANPFLGVWDERFHALVARNMVNNSMLQPMLRLHPINSNFDKFGWCGNHIWLHKQPLFLWQMALSMKAFGTSIFAMRLPSVVLGTLLIVLVYRITWLVFTNKQVACIVAFLIAFANMHLQMIAGIHEIDHNDVAYGFYIMASIWAFVEYTQKPLWHWVVLIGVFAACAILNKWLTGLLVYLAWAYYIFSKRKNNNWINEIKKFLLSLLVCCVIFLPWQLYILHTYPDLAHFEFAYNNKHIFTAVEGHKGNIFYYLIHFPFLFGQFLYLLLPYGIYLALKKYNYNRKISVVFIFVIVFVFCFYSFVAQTKMESYIFFIIPLCYVFVALGVFELKQRINANLLKFIYLLFIAYLALNPFDLFKNTSNFKNECRNNRIYNANIYKNIESVLPNNIKIVMNINNTEDIDFMFYHPDIAAYGNCISKHDIELLNKNNIPFAVFASHGIYILPDYVVQSPNVFVIKQEIKDIEF